MPLVDAFEKQVVARLLDFFAFATPWYRRLWCPSVRLALDETLEASHAARAGVLHDELLMTTAQLSLALAGPDVGVGAKETKKALQQALKKALIPDGVDYATVKLIMSEIVENYLHRWSESLARGEHPGVERTARAIASHLLDEGFSYLHLHRWCKYQAFNAAGANSLSELVENAHAMTRAARQEFSVLVTFDGVPESQSGSPSNWIGAQDVVGWLQARGLDVSGVQQNGALLFRVPARDAWSAVQSAVTSVDQLSSRVALGTSGRLKPSGHAWVDGVTRRFPFSPPRRRVEVHALHREDKLYTVEPTSIVDTALHMMSALNSGPPSTAITSGWAAMEALLTGPGDSDIVAGSRLASLVTCSFVRAELTALSYKLPASDATGAQVRACISNRDRAAVMAEAINRGLALTLRDESDIAAVQRLRVVLGNAYDGLRDIQNHVTAVFTRMYKNRNLVIHWGKTDAVGLESNLRCVAPLAGAGIDRIAHAWFVTRTKPMELVAKAKYALDIVGTVGAPLPVDLLE